MSHIEYTQVVAIISTITSFSLVMARNWRTNIILLAVQYVGVFVLVSASWSINMALIKLVAGWIACTVLGMGMKSFIDIHPEGKTEPQSRKLNLRRMFSSTLHLLSERAFYILTGLLIILVIGSQIPLIIRMIPGIQVEHAWSGLILISFGLLKTGFTDQPFHTTIGVLAFLSGFEILYAMVQSSLLMAGLLSGVTMVISITGAYLLLSNELEYSD